MWNCRNRKLHCSRLLWCFSINGIIFKNQKLLNQDIKVIKNSKVKWNCPSKYCTQSPNLFSCSAWAIIWLVLQKWPHLRILMSMVCLGPTQTFVKSQGDAVLMQAVLLQLPLPCPAHSPSPQAGLAAASMDWHILGAGTQQRRGDTASLSSAMCLHLMVWRAGFRRASGNIWFLEIFYIILSLIWIKNVRPI